jgi:hypothetical protein
MKRFLTVALVGVLALGLTSTAYANLCAFDPVPASTLLFPFVQYDYDNPGTTTLFAITNVSEQAQIVHITIWTDYSVAILDFNVVLTGYDVQTINIRDILRDGFLPTYDPLGEGGLVRDANIWTDEPWEDRSDPSEAPTPYPSGPYSPNNDLGNAVDPFPGLPDPEATWDGVEGLGGIDCTGTDCIDPSWMLNCKPDDLTTGFVSEGWLSSPANYVDPIPGDTLLLFQGYFLASQTAPTAYANCAYDDTVDISTWWTAGRTGPAWMYVTADVVGACNKDLPDNDYATYFDYDAVTGTGVRWPTSSSATSSTSTPRTSSPRPTRRCTSRPLRRSPRPASRVLPCRPPSTSSTIWPMRTPASPSSTTASRCRPHGLCVTSRTTSTRPTPGSAPGRAAL